MPKFFRARDLTDALRTGDRIELENLLGRKEPATATVACIHYIDHQIDHFYVVRDDHVLGATCSDHRNPFTYVLGKNHSIRILPKGEYSDPMLESEIPPIIGFFQGSACREVDFCPKCHELIPLDREHLCH